MKFKFAVLFLLVTLFVVPALAHENTTHTVSFDGFSFDAAHPALTTPDMLVESFRFDGLAE